MLAKLLVWLAIAGLYMWNAGALEQKTIEALPPGILTCQNVSTSVEDCLRDEFNTMLKASKNGIPELNVPATDPLLLDKLKIEFSNEILRGKAIARGVKIYGYSDCKIQDLNYQRNETIIRLDLHTLCPKMQVTGAYRAKININNAKILSRGDINFTMTDTDTQSQNFAEIYDHNNQTFVRVIKVDFAPKLGHMHIGVTGLLPEPALNDALLEVLNRNWRSVATSTLPAVQSTMEPIIKKIFNEILSRIPLHLLVKV